MTISYELVDTDDGNMIGSYSSMAQAGDVVRAAYAAAGAQGVRSLALIEVDRQSGRQTLIAADNELAHRVMGAVLRRVIVSNPGQQSTATGAPFSIFLRGRGAVRMEGGWRILFSDLPLGANRVAARG